MKTKITLLLAFAFCSIVSAQIATDYEVATWYGFKTCAVTFTFDDGTSNQMPIAKPLLDQYGFKATFFPVINWGPNWTQLKVAVANGHEVGCHTVSHTNLTTITSSTTLTTEIVSPKTTINSNIPAQKCITIAYPNCATNQQVTDICKLNYIGGRTCSGQIVPATPSDFFAISSIATGTTGVNTSPAMNDKVKQAKTAKGWCVFMIHGINADGGYSPTQDSVLNAHFQYLTNNSADYWVGAFGNVIKYIKERNSVSIAESVISVSQYKVIVNDTLSDNTIYNAPLTVRRKLPTSWDTAYVYRKGSQITSTIKNVSGTKYIVFDAVPDTAAITVSKTKLSTGFSNVRGTLDMKLNPNPFNQSMSLLLEGEFNYSVFSLQGKLVENGKGVNSVLIGNKLNSGFYLLKVKTTDNKEGYCKIIKN